MARLVNESERKRPSVKTQQAESDRAFKSLMGSRLIQSGDEFDAATASRLVGWTTDRTRKKLDKWAKQGHIIKRIENRKALYRRGNGVKPGKLFHRTCSNSFLIGHVPKRIGGVL